MLDVSYDDCVASDDDGINEMWYSLDWFEYSRHISHEIDTIEYYFEEFSVDGTCSWTTATDTPISETAADEIKAAFADSMEKWNNVYFYSYDSRGNLVKHKIINVVEGTATDNNLSIYPTNYNGVAAATMSLPDCESVIEDSEIEHTHTEWIIEVSVSNFYTSGELNDELEVIWERTGAHELGHILGLCDVDSCCSAGEYEIHHEEILMGSGYPVSTRCTDITYKDIAGVAITRGFTIYYILLTKFPLYDIIFLGIILAEFIYLSKRRKI